MEKMFSITRALITTMFIIQGILVASVNRKIKLINNCDLDIYVSICWHDPSVYDWMCGCWRSVDANDYVYATDEDGYYIYTDYSYAYFYAETLFGLYVWDGVGDYNSRTGTCNGNTYKYFKQSDNDNDYVIEPAFYCSRRGLRDKDVKVAVEDAAKGDLEVDPKGAEDGFEDWASHVEGWTVGDDHAN